MSLKINIAFDCVNISGWICVVLPVVGDRTVAPRWTWDVEDTRVDRIVREFVDQVRLQITGSGRKLEISTDACLRHIAFVVLRTVIQTGLEVRLLGDVQIILISSPEIKTTEKIIRNVGRVSVLLALARTQVCRRTFVATKPEIFSMYGSSSEAMMDHTVDIA